MQALSIFCLTATYASRFRLKQVFWDTHGVIFIFKTSPSQTYIQLQAQKGLTRVGPRRQTNELLVLLNEAEQLNHSYPMVTF